MTQNTTNDNGSADNLPVPKRTEQTIRFIDGEETERLSDRDACLQLDLARHHDAAEAFITAPKRHFTSLEDAR